MDKGYVRDDRLRGALVLAIAGSTLWHLSLSAQQPAPAGRDEATRPGSAAAPTVFEGATVVDVTNGRLLPERTVVVAGNRIQAVGPASTVRVPPGAQVVDARGKYLIPGLWDMHAHVDRESRDFYPRFIAHGVTGIREMAQRFKGGSDSFRIARRDIAAGERVGPRLAGPSTDLTHQQDAGISDATVAEGISLRTPDDVRRVIDSLKSDGVTFLKYHDDSGEPALYFAVLREARRVGLPVVGHVPEKVTRVEASDSGQRSIEHLNENIPCVPNVFSFDWPDSLADSVSDGCAAMVKAYIRNGTWMTPTIDLFLLPLSYQERQKWRGYSVLQAMYRLGFRRFLAGTDVTPGGSFSAFLVPGASLVEEVVFLTEGGLTPLEALQAATLHPAQFFDATDSLGTIAPDKLADLVLLDADPLADIYNLIKVRAVVADGRYFDRATLDAMDPVGLGLIQDFADFAAARRRAAAGTASAAPRSLPAP